MVLVVSLAMLKKVALRIYAKVVEQRGRRKAVDLHVGPTIVLLYPSISEFKHLPGWGPRW